ncbi:MAG: hypothetical protein K2P67_07465 [Gallionellaceae bacterium]|nr:hypothetical protein [Gallionellaceae bacterium]
MKKLFNVLLFFICLNSPQAMAVNAQWSGPWGITATSGADACKQLAYAAFGAWRLDFSWGATNFMPTVADPLTCTLYRSNLGDTFTLQYKLTSVTCAGGAAFNSATLDCSAPKTPGQKIMEAVDFSSVIAWVIALGVCLIGIALIYKAITFSKRTVARVTR